MTKQLLRPRPFLVAPTWRAPFGRAFDPTPPGGGAPVPPKPYARAPVAGFAVPEGQQPDFSREPGEYFARRGGGAQAGQGERARGPRGRGLLLRRLGTSAQSPAGLRLRSSP